LATAAAGAPDSRFTTPPLPPPTSSSTGGAVAARSPSFLVQEGTSNAAGKKQAWNAALAVFNEAAAEAGAKYKWSQQQLKVLWGNKRKTYLEWVRRAEQSKTGRDNFWADPKNASSKPYFFDAMEALPVDV